MYTKLQSDLKNVSYKLDKEKKDQVQATTELNARLLVLSTQNTSYTELT